MDVPQQADDVLAQPTRARIFSVLSESRQPVGTDDLARHLDLHHNGVRQHLDRMLSAGLVVRERPRHGRGRPRDMWSIAPGAQPGGTSPTAYADLGKWLARAAPKTKTGQRALEATGREIGRELVVIDAAGSAEERMHAALSAMGFAPQRQATADGGLTYELCNCPYRDAVLENRDAVCTLHKGITQGLIGALSPKTKLSAFVPNDPIEAGCLIELQGPLAQEGRDR